ncbi:hypothetical protein [Gorillibacterium sp. CAU 1737]|uniref:hypothetical protein n=1 Tax=Gorillibacterium sp. CAU 1737 TaxID=3140362 RepID=UPI00325FED29
MQLKPEIRAALESIQFIDRYKALSRNYSFDGREKFRDYDNHQVLHILDELGYKATFNKKEKFFKIVEKLPSYQFQFTISLSHSVIEFIWAVWKDGELKTGSPWDTLKELVDGTEDLVSSPVFRHYEDLKGILTESLRMYQDFKQELLSIYGVDNSGDSSEGLPSAE